MPIIVRAPSRYDVSRKLRKPRSRAQAYLQWGKAPSEPGDDLAEDRFGRRPPQVDGDRVLPLPVPVEDDRVGPPAVVGRQAYGERAGLGEEPPRGALERLEEVTDRLGAPGVARLRKRKPALRVDLPVVDPSEAERAELVQELGGAQDEAPVLLDLLFAKERRDLADDRNRGRNEQLVRKVELDADARFLCPRTAPYPEVKP
jgi:hypothetical protein